MQMQTKNRGGGACLKRREAIAGTAAAGAPEKAQKEKQERPEEPL